MSGDSKHSVLEPDQYTRSGARRAGDDFQDIVAIGFFLDWLENPSAYVTMAVEDEESGVLDDIRKERSDQAVELVQVKFSTAPTESKSHLTLQELLAERPSRIEGKKLPSLLFRWCESFFDVRMGGKAVQAFIVTNRLPADDLKTALDSEHIRLDRVLDEKIKTDLLRQLGGEQRAKEFFEGTVFQLARDSLDTLEEHYEQRFCRRGGERVGWLNLKEEVRRWVRYKNCPSPDGVIRLAHIQQAADWKQPRALPQDFTIPPDFVLPSNDFYEDLLNRLNQPDNQCVAVVGAPASGKSTFVSWLCRDLRAKKMPIVRHHYFLSVSERMPGRLDHERAAESLLHDLIAEHSEALGDLVTHRLQPADLPRCLESCGAFYDSRGVRLVVVVDGLDHVWTETKSVDELRRLFDWILPSPKGIAILVAMQPVDDSRLPPSLLRLAPRQSWLPLPTFGRAEVRDWLKHHLDALPAARRDQEEDYQLDRLADAFFASSNGHPLHLRYTLEALLQKAMSVTPENIRTLPGCPHGHIEDYYGNLWRALPTGAQTGLMLLSVCEWAWPLSGLIDVLQHAGTTLVEAETGRREIRHLLSEKFLGLEPHHPSLAAFVRKQDLFQSSGERLLRAALAWLQTDAPAHWRWAHEWEVESKLGNAGPLQNGPSRQWVIEALVQCKLRRELTRILRRASWEAANADDWPRVVALGTWLEYSDRAWDDQGRALNNILQTQFILGEDPFLSPRLQEQLHDLEASHLVDIASGEFDAGASINLSRVAEELRRRFNEAVQDERRNSNALSLLRHTACVRPLLGGQATSRFARFCLERVTADALKSELLGKMAEASRASKLRDSIMALLKLLPDHTGISLVSPILEHAVLYALENGIDLLALLPHTPTIYPALFGVHEILRGRKASLLEPPVALFKLRHAYEQRGEIANGYQRAFWFFAGNHLLNSSEANARWLSNFEPGRWPMKFLEPLEAAAADFVKHVREKSRFPIAKLYARLKDLDKPKWNVDHSSASHYAEAAQAATTELALDITAAAPGYGQASRITASDLNAAKDSAWWPSLMWTSAFLQRRRGWLDSEAVDFLEQHELQGLAEIGESFETRADLCASIALLLARHGRNESAREWLRRSADNLIAHGYHKDLPLNEALDSVQAVIPVCERTSDRVAEEPLHWLKLLAPPIVHVNEFTDGDEVHHLPVQLAEALAEAEPRLLSLLHHREWLIDEERYDEAEDVLAIFIRKADLSVPLNFALAKTAISPEARKEIALRAATGNPFAQDIERSIVAVYGEYPPQVQEPAPLPSESSASLFEKRPVPSEFPPERLKEFLKALNASGQISDHESIAQWVATWRSRANGTDLLRALAELRDSVPYFRNHDELFELQRELEGTAAAYITLVEGFRSDRGWTHYWSDADRAKRHREQVLRYYPDKKRQFLIDTLRRDVARDDHQLGLGALSWVRLIEYFIECGETEMARRLAKQAVASACELVSPLLLPVPSWATRDAR
jgi:hypothetical protein